MYLDTIVHDDPSPIISLTIINEKHSGESLESLSVPIQTDLLPLATMPDQTTNIDEQRIPDQTVQHVLSASLEPTKLNHIESITEIIPTNSFISKENNQIHEELFDIETEKPTITLAEAEKLQHDAAIEQKDEVLIEPELSLTVPILNGHSLEKNDILEEKLTNKKIKPNTKKKIATSPPMFVEKNEEQIVTQKLEETGLDNRNPKIDSESEKSKCNGENNISNGNHLSDVSITEPEQECVRPKFSLRLQPTTTVNDGDRLRLEVHFIGHTQPKVFQTKKKTYTRIFS